MSEELTFEQEEIAVEVLEQLQNALENKSLNALLLNDYRLRCMLRFVQDLIDEKNEG